MVLHEQLEDVRQILTEQCDQVEAIDRRTVLRIWRDWNIHYPLELKQVNAISNSWIVHRLHDLRGSLNGRNAINAYERQMSGAITVLSADVLVGWRCCCDRLPALDHLDANLILTSDDFAWTFGIQELYRRTLYRGGPVFVETDVLT